MADTSARLTHLSHGGGGGSKIAPAILEKILAGLTPGVIPPQLLVGVRSGDDAAVYQINEQQAIVAATDFYTPIVDDPFDFGCIAAAGAISNIYAKGANPLFALALVGMPVNVLSLDVIGKVLEGGESVCRQIGIPVAGGHTIDSVEPIYGLVVIGLLSPGHLKRNTGARPGDRLVLAKPLGVGVYSTALRRGMLGNGDYEALLASTTRLNTPGPLLSCLEGVHAVTDVSGFGVLGHVLGLCRGSGVAARLDFASLPLLGRALEFAAAGCVTGASGRNWVSYGQHVRLPDWIGDKERALLTDPQTSGGLLVACAPDTATEVLSVFLQQAFTHVSPIGELGEGEPSIEVF